MKPRLFLILIVATLFTASCSRQSTQRAQGYIEGRYTYIATSVSGVLKEIAVLRGSQVKQGDHLFTLEAQPESDAYQAALDNLKQTIAARDAITANLSYAKIMYQRYKILLPKNAIQQSQLDNAKSTYYSILAQLSQAEAAIASSQATLAQAKWTAQQKLVYAPVDAIVFDTYYRLGEYTEANQAILSLLAPQDIKAIFYVPYSQLSHIQLGDQVEVSYERGGQTYTGRVSFISPAAEYTPPVIYSEQTNEKLIYRLEAEFKPADAIHLHPGQPVTVVYHTHE